MIISVLVREISFLVWFNVRLFEVTSNCHLQRWDDHLFRHLVYIRHREQVIDRITALLSLIKSCAKRVLRHSDFGNMLGFSVCLLR